MSAQRGVLAELYAHRDGIKLAHDRARGKQRDDFAEVHGNFQEAVSAIEELIAAARHYMEVRGSTHGQPARRRLAAALASMDPQPGEDS